MGCSLYLDDFGTGYSNFERVMRIPFNIIKFDKSLLDFSNEDKRFKLITNNLAKMYNELGYDVLFEGIETEADIKMCTKEMSAKYLQGFHYSKPIPIENFKNFLKKKKD